MRKRAMLPKDVWDSRVYKFTHGILAGDILAISGQNGIDIKGKIVGKASFETQTRLAFQNMAKILAEARMTFDNVIMIRSYFTDIGKINKFTEIQSEFFGENYPAATAIEVNKLALPELLIEIDALAVR